MRRHLIAFAALLAGLAALTAGHAARDPAKPGPGIELIVFEAAGCAYCDVFRRDVLPQYRAAPLATRAPIRFVDVNRVDTDTLPLKSRVTSVPTAVLMHEGREFDRVTGYVGPQNFFRMISWMLDRID